MVDSDLLSKVRELRAGGRTPKQIAWLGGIGRSGCQSADTW